MIILVVVVLIYYFYSGINLKVRNDSRRLNLENIGRSIEINHVDKGYQPIGETKFSKNLLRATDLGGVPFCINVQDKGVADPPTWNSQSCPKVGSWLPVSGLLPLQNTTFWKVCTVLESDGTYKSKVLCLSNAQ